MRKHHTKNKGDLGVLKAKLDIFTQGWTICTPETEHAEFDLVAYKDGVFKRIQVKYRASIKGKISIPFTTVWNDRHGTHTNLYDKNSIDIICVYCPTTDLCYYFDITKFNKSVVLRINAAKNNQKSKINMADDYRLMP